MRLVFLPLSTRDGVKRCKKNLHDFPKFLQSSDSIATGADVIVMVYLAGCDFQPHQYGPDGPRHCWGDPTFSCRSDGLAENCWGCLISESQINW